MFFITTNGPYCYRINGQVYHLMSQMQPKEGKTPRFSQIYICDNENELDNHLNSFSNLDRNLLKDLQDMMKEVNPYAKTYNHVSQVIKEKPTEDAQLDLKTTRNTIDPRRYNLPTGTDVAVIIPMERNEISRRDVVIYKNC